MLNDQEKLIAKLSGLCAYQHGILKMIADIPADEAPWLQKIVNQAKTSIADVQRFYKDLENVPPTDASGTDS